MATTSTSNSATICCSFCNTPGANMKCKPCSDAGQAPIAAYCDPLCQKKHWPGHKLTCAHSENRREAFEANLRLKMSDPEAMRKTMKNMFRAVMCQHCFKSGGKGTKLLLCSNCKVINYCSTQCQIQHWPAHKLICKTTEKASKLAKSTTFDLLEQWKTKSAVVLAMAVASALSRKQMQEQPSSFVVSLDLIFNYNLKTFLFGGKPTLVKINDLPGIDKNLILQRMKEKEDYQKRGLFDEAAQCYHFAFVRCDGIACLKPFIFYQEDADYSVAVACSKQITLKSSLFADWVDRLQANFTSQLRVLELTVEYAGFLNNSFRLLSKKPRHKTHVIVIHFEFGPGLGKMGSLTSYEVTTLENIRNIFHGHTGVTEEDKKYALETMLDVESAPEFIKARATNPNVVLLPVIFMHKPSHQFCLPKLMQMRSGRKSVNQCDEAADQDFRRLQLRTLSLPEVDSPTLD